MTRDELFDLTVQLAEFLKGTTTVFVTYEGNLDDFTVSFPGTLQIFSRNKVFDLPIPSRDVNWLTPVLSVLLFSSDRLTLCWDVKKIFSYLRFHLDEFYDIVVESKMIDIKLAEAFIGKHESKPQSWTEAVERTRAIANNKQLSEIRRRLHVPLITKVVPRMETAGLLDIENYCFKYASYEPEGQANGRLSCKIINNKFYNPHSLGEAERKKYKPGCDKKFVLLDYKYMEVSILHWLSQDERLGNILNSPQRDFYRSVFEIISGQTCRSDANRQFAKDIFLPVVFGQQAKSLGERLGISTNGAQLLIDRIHKSFPTALEWVSRQVDSARKNNNVFTDYFGRTRYFNDLWKVRNAAIQGPASVVCLDKLVALQERMPLGMRLASNVHDAYLMVADDKTVEYTAETAAEILTEPNDFYPGLRLAVDCKISDTL